MKRYAFLLSAVIVGCGERMLDPLDPGSFPQYSGTVTIEVATSKNVFDYYRDGKKLRIVPKVSGPAGAEPSMALIVDEEARTATAVSLATKRYVVRSITDKMTRTGMSWPLGQKGHQPKIISRETIGQENIGSHSCIVLQVVMESADGTHHTVKMWSARDLQGFAVKVDSTEGKVPFSLTFSDVRLGSVGDPSLFEIPLNFKNANG